MMGLTLLRSTARQARAAIRPLFDPLQDATAMVRFAFQNPTGQTKFLQLRAVGRRTGATTFVETGTFYGEMAARCAGHFAHVYTIELSKQLAGEARRRLAPYANVEVIEGDSTHELPKLMSKPNLQNVLVYLDGHYSGGITVQGEVPEPAIMELVGLESHHHLLSAIVIDDFRCFGTEPDYPAKHEVLRAAERFQPYGFKVSVHLDQVIIERF